MAKKELQVAAIENGTVIDHIPAVKTYQVARLLHLHELDEQITIGYNLPSRKVGRKGIVKVSNKYFTEEEVSKLSVIAPKIVLNIIEAIRRKPLKQEIETYVTLVGVVIMVVLMIAVTWNDIMRTFF